MESTENAEYHMITRMQVAFNQTQKLWFHISEIYSHFRSTVFSSEVARGSGCASAPSKVLIWRNSGQNPWKPGHRCFDIFVLFVWIMTLTDLKRLNLTFFSEKVTYCERKFCRGKHFAAKKLFRQKSFTRPSICLLLLHLRLSYSA